MYIPEAQADSKGLGGGKVTKTPGNGLQYRSGSLVPPALAIGVSLT